MLSWSCSVHLVVVKAYCGTLSALSEAPRLWENFVASSLRSTFYCCPTFRESDTPVTALPLARPSIPFLLLDGMPIAVVILQVLEVAAENRERLGTMALDMSGGDRRGRDR